MKRWFHCLFICALLVGALGVVAQDANNLLTNPGFEGEYVEQGGSPVRLVASSWTAWNTPHSDTDSDSKNRQPIYEPAAPNTDRIRSGTNAQLLYNNTYWGHEAGVFQQVTGITPGTELRFSVYAYVWSSSFDDPEISEQPGDVTIEVGIDPTGATDPTSNNIVWSFAVDQYDAYRQYSQIATAASSTVTVWVRSTVGFAVRNTYVYLDDAVLEITPDGPSPVAPVATDTDTPTPTATDVVPTDVVPTDTPTATLTITPSNTPTPTDTGIPDEEPSPTREGPSPTPTPTTDAVVPSDTPTPTATTPILTNTPRPTSEGVTFFNTLIYNVRRGDTVGRIAILYGSTVEAINEANGLNEDNLIFINQQLIVPVPLARPMTVTPSPSPIPSNTPLPSETPEILYATPDQSVVQTVYVVQRGDTLSTIAMRFNTTVAELAQANNILNTNRIFAGQSIVISGEQAIAPVVTPQPQVPQYYLVQYGDTLSRISVRFGVSISALIEANGIYNPNFIYAGQTLIIP